METIINKKNLIVLLMVLVFNLGGGKMVFAQTNDIKNDKLLAKIKKKVNKSGVSEKTKVRVELKNQTILKGYVSAIEDDSFSLTDKKTGSITKVVYTEVKKFGNTGISTAAKIGIVVAIAVPVTIALTLLNIRCNNEGGCF